MQRIFIFIFLAFFSLELTSIAQTSIQEVATGAGYQKQSYANLSAGTEHQVNNDAWDIAFTVAGIQDAGIFINESSGFSMGTVLPRIHLFDAATTNFTLTPDPGLLQDYELLNDEISWDYGAFNVPRDPSNFGDYGWGAYNFQTNQVVGDRVYVVQLRDGSYKKLQVISLAGTTYTFKYANLDGSNEQTKTIDKTAHAGKMLAYFSFATNNTVNVEPAGGFDLIYSRYVTTIFDPGTQTYIDYTVTGFLHPPGSAACVAKNIDPNSVQFAPYQDSLSTKLDAVGYEYKYFSGTEWVVDFNRVSFLKTPEDRLWKLFFLDFEGSSTGKTIIEKTDLGTFVSVNTPQELGLKAVLYPNPVQHQLTVGVDLPKDLGTEAQLQVLDMAGRLVSEQSVRLQAGVQVFELPAESWNAGLHHVRLLLSDKEIKLGKVVKM